MARADHIADREGAERRRVPAAPETEASIASARRALASWGRSLRIPDVPAVRGRWSLDPAPLNEVLERTVGRDMAHAAAALERAGIDGMFGTLRRSVAIRTGRLYQSLRVRVDAVGSRLRVVASAQEKYAYMAKYAKRRWRPAGVAAGVRQWEHGAIAPMMSAAEQLLGELEGGADGATR